MSGIMVRQVIEEAIEKHKLIENHDLQQCLGPASYELRIGSYWDWNTRTDIDLRKGDGVAIAPNGFVLIGTCEKVNLPNNVLGLLYLRSTFARSGFVPWFMGLVDPGYSGTLTVPLHNLTGDLIPLSGEDRICHIVFEELPEAAEKGYAGQYQNSSGAMPAQQKPTLKVIGHLDMSPNGTFEGMPRALAREVLRNPSIIRGLYGG